MDALNAPKRRGKADRAAIASAWATLVVTNSIKLTGLVFAVRELLTTKDAVIMGICVVMMSGAQGLEQTILAFFERFFSQQAGDDRR